MDSFKQQLIKKNTNPNFGDTRDIIQIIIEMHYNDIYRFVNSKINNKDITCDICQDAFEKIIISFNKKKYVEKGKILSWMLKIANNQVMDYFRQEKKKIKLIEKLSKNQNTFVQPNCIEEMKTEFAFLAKILVDLTPEQREVFLLRVKENMKFKDIAIIQNKNINTVLGRYRYAVAHLKQALDKKYGTKSCSYFISKF